MAKTYVGVDVGKVWLDVAVHEGAASWRVSNDVEGIEQLTQELQELGATLVVFEATGGLEMPAVLALSSAGVGVAVVNPTRVRDFRAGNRRTGENRRNRRGGDRPFRVCGASTSAALAK